MEYLRRQHRRAEQALRDGVPLEDAFATKFYIQTLLRESIVSFVPRGSRVLEVGCGGSLAIHLLDRLGYSCAALDLAPDSLAFAALLRRYFGSGVQLVRADGFRLPFAAAAFDYVFSVGLVEHFEEHDQQGLVAEMCRCSSGLVHLELPNYDPRSAFHPVLLREREAHRPYDLPGLLTRAGAAPLVHDGRGVFPRRELVVANPALRAFVESVEGYDPSPSHTREDIARLAGLERGLSPRDRIRYGYQVYAIASV